MQKTFILAILAIFGLSFFASTYAGQVEEAGMKWYDDMDEAKAAAEKSDKLIYIYFTGGQGCGWCVKMKGETFSNSDVQSKVLSKYVIVMLMVWDTQTSKAKTEDKQLLGSYGGRGVPFNVVLDKDLKLVKKFSGYKSATDFIKEMEPLPKAYKELAKLLKKVEKKSGQKYKNYYEIAKIYSETLIDKVKAGEFAQKALEKDEENKEGNHAELNYMLLEKAAAENKSEEVKKFMAKVKELDEKNKEGYYEKVVQIEIATYLNNKDWTNAIKVYTEFADSEVDFHKDQKQTTKWFVAVAYINNKDWGNAKKFLKEVIDLDKDNAIGKTAAKYLEQIEGQGF